jgi:hypothetical protein
LKEKKMEKMKKNKGFAEWWKRKDGVEVTPLPLRTL